MHRTADRVLLYNSPQSTTADPHTVTVICRHRSFHYSPCQAIFTSNLQFFTGVALGAVRFGSQDSAVVLYRSRKTQRYCETVPGVRDGL